MDKQTEGGKFTDAAGLAGPPAQLPVSRGGLDGAAGEDEDEGGAAGAGACAEDGDVGAAAGAEAAGAAGAAGGAVAGAAAFLTWPSCHLPAKACRSESRLRRSCPLTVRL